MNRWHSLPAELYRLVEQTPGSVLLECAQPLDSEADTEECTRLFTAPLRIYIANTVEELPALFAEIESAVAAGQCAAGYFAYECGAFFEPTAALRPMPAGQPLAWFGIYDRVSLFHHRTGAFLNGAPPSLAEFRANAQAEPHAAEPIGCSINVSEEQYAEHIAAIHEWIRAGDVYQLNFTVPMHVQAHGSQAALYQRLRARQPAPYGAFLHTQEDHRILSFSPELFFRIENEVDARRITARPMKGTAPRGRTTREDRQMSAWLRNDPKNRSENVMIVDLLRNDLGRLCMFGSVRAEKLFAVERYPTLWQMTSTVSGNLRPDVTYQQIFRALFPCGSVTGAPKVRAMQLLAEIEDQPRGVYTGAIGFFSKDRTVFNVAIRTLDLLGEAGRMGLGSGIVIDSNAAAEFRECLLKAEFLTSSSTQLPAHFSLIETMLWNGAYPLIELHLDRLEDSANYFGYLFDRPLTHIVLLNHAAQFPDPQPRKVRLLLDADGALRIEDEVLPDPQSVESSSPLRVRIASERIDPSDRMFAHKTTHRPLYAEALTAATKAGYDDVLFLNLREEVTEGAIHNLLIQKDGRLFTPPVECGVLPGVHRRHLLQTRSDVEERILHIDDLRTADALYLSNAVRGLRPAIIDWNTNP
jgi:para-aminobenzoate synthetase/4-amino-4-deoxychorismate lyase